MNARQSKAKSLFLNALELVTPSQRQAYLDGQYGGDMALRREVEDLLRHVGQVGSFLESAPAHSLPATSDDPISERPGTVIGPYKLMEQVGEGGMGLVFVAEQQQPVRRKVALKVIKPGMDTRQVVARFEAERQALALMDHPNIAKVLDGGETAGGRPYFVMELVKGMPITEFYDQNQVPIRQRLELFVSVCQAVQHAHQKGIIHRDIKPSNVLVVSHDGTPVVKVIDFGVAKAIGQQLTDKTIYTQFSQMVGTPLCMSPEQAGQSGLDVDTRSDIYSLGVLLYELLTGTTPFDREHLHSASYDEIRRVIREEEPLRPSARIGTLGQAAITLSTQRQSDPRQLSRLFRGELDWIVMKALEKDRNRRYESASAFAADVERYLGDEPVLACPPSAAYRLHKFVRRNKGALAAVSVLAVALLVVVGVIAGSFGWMARDRSVRQAKLQLQMEHALDDATRARDEALTHTDDPYRWEAALTEVAFALKRAQELDAQDETAIGPALRERLQAAQVTLDADTMDRRFVARFEEIQLEVPITNFKAQVAFTALKEVFQRQYHIEFGVTPIEQAVTILRQRSQAVQDFLLTALDVSLDDTPKDDRQTRPWLTSVLDAVDTGSWRKRAKQAVGASDWKALDQLIEEATTARQSRSLLIRLARMIPADSPSLIPVGRRICRAYPGDFWANMQLANWLQYSRFPQLEESIRYYYAALALQQPSLEPGRLPGCQAPGSAPGCRTGRKSGQGGAQNGELLDHSERSPLPIRRLAGVGRRRAGSDPAPSGCRLPLGLGPGLLLSSYGPATTGQNRRRAPGLRSGPGLARGESQGRR